MHVPFMSARRRGRFVQSFGAVPRRRAEPMHGWQGISSSGVPCHYGWQATGQVEYIADGVFKLTLSSRLVSRRLQGIPPSLLGVCRMALSVLSSVAGFGEYL